MPKERVTDVVGDIGAHLAAIVLAPIATVEPRGEGMELDYYCELREYPGCVFHVQAKGSSNPTYSRGMISSLPIRRTTVENFWLKQPYPVYILMSDTRASRTFYMRISKETYATGSTETLVFKIPLTNELTPENVGLLTPEILRNQPHMTLEEAAAQAQEYKLAHPLLYHDLSQIESFLEIMRGSDQSAQLQAKIAIQTLAQSGSLDSHKLENELLSIFRNCKDHITQKHVLDTLVALQASSASHEIVKQIDRNTRLYEYQTTPPPHRHTHITFLFHGLARLKPTNISDDIKRLLSHPDPNVSHGTIWLIGELRIRGFTDTLIDLLNSPNRSIRLATGEALSKLGQQNIQSALQDLIRLDTSPHQLAAAIDVLRQSGATISQNKIAKLKIHQSANVRRAAAEYLGTSQSTESLEDLFALIGDNDHDVRSAAARGITANTSISDTEKEKLILAQLAPAFDAKHELKTAALLGVLHPYASEASREGLTRIYRLDAGRVRNYMTFDIYGNWQSTVPIDLKTSALSILQRLGLDGLEEEVISDLRTCETQLIPRYLEVVRARKITKAFDAIAESPQDRIESWAGLCFQVLDDLDSSRALDFCKQVITATNSPILMSHACELLERHSIDPQSIGNFKSRILGLFSLLDNRRQPFLYRIIRHYRFEEAGPVIVQDLPILLGPAADSFAMPVGEMFETLAALQAAEGHEALKQLLPRSAPNLRRAILEYLSRYQPAKAIPLLERHRADPELSIRELCARLLERIKKVGI